MSAWTPEGEPVTATEEVVTLVEGTSFCLSRTNGDLGGAGPIGVFFEDTRILQACELAVDDAPPEPLGVMTPEPYRAVFLGRVGVRAGRSRSTLLIERDRRVGNGIREDLSVRNVGPADASCTVTVRLAADFADVFEVKGDRVDPATPRRVQADASRLVLSRGDADGRGTVVETTEPGAFEAGDDGTHGVLRFDVQVPSRGEWRTTLLVRPVVAGGEVEAAFPVGLPLEDAAPAVRRQRWRAEVPRITTGHPGLQRVLDRSLDDLGSLRIFDREAPTDPARAAVAAGSPWFMALFGRDSLLTASMALPVDRDLALGTLRALARRQGEVVDPVSEEEPGRILHEVRLGAESGRALGGSAYYGTADASPLFVVLLGQLASWGADPADVAALLPHADRALRWVAEHGDRDGDGFVEYERSSEQGLENQGWKDSWDAVNRADGTIVTAPVALCEVQGYVYDAYRSRARLAEGEGDTDAALAWEDRASALRAAFDEAFWLPDRGWYAVALDRNKRPVDSCTSNIGHVLWSGIVDPARADQVVEHLMSPKMFTGWGVRTLASDMGAYDPVSYHNGSVWPHDNALIVAGLVRYGYVEEATRLAGALLEAAEAFDGRLPELFCGFDRSEYAEPVPYPTSCSPQAWAAAAPVQLLTSLLRLEPRLDEGRVHVDPVLPASYAPLRVEGLRLGAERHDLAL